MKIRNKMIVSITLVILFIGTITSVIWYRNSVNTINQYLLDYSNSVMKNTYESIKSVMDNVNYTEVMISNNTRNIVTPLKNNYINRFNPNYEYDRLENDRKINDLISSAFGYKDYLCGIAIFPKDFHGQYYKIGAITSNPDELYQEIIQIDPRKMEHRSVLLMPKPTDNRSISNMSSVVPMVKTISNTTGEIYGYIAVMFDYTILEKIAESSLPTGSKMQITNESGQFFYTNCGDESLTKTSNNVYQLAKNKYAYNELEFQERGLTCRMQIPADTLLGNVNKTIFFILGVYVVLFTAAILVVVYISYRMTKDVMILNEAMLKVGTGDLNSRVYVGSKDEIGSMATVFNNMTLRLKELITEVKKTEQSKREAEINFLQAQINPHFLSNILNTVTYLAQIQNAENISNLTSALVELLHSAMRTGEEIITVQNEINYIRSYVKIEQYCYVDNFEVNYDIEPGVEQLYIPRFLLQPIVENALIHSLNELTDRIGKLNISIHIENGKLLIVTRDNGRGMTPEQIEYALHHEKQRGTNEFSSIGVHNVLERIRLMYGDEYGIKFDSKLGEYTSVTLILPINNKKE